jgi:hypothetical protein
VRLMTWWVICARPCLLGGVADRIHAGGRGPGVAGGAANWSPFVQLSQFPQALLSHPVCKLQGGLSCVHADLQLCTGGLCCMQGT